MEILILQIISGQILLVEALTYIFKFKKKNPINLNYWKSRKQVNFLVDSPLRPLAPHPPRLRDQKNGLKKKRTKK